MVTIRAVTILRGIISRVRVGVNRVRIYSGRCKPVLVTLIRVALIVRITLVKPVHPWVIAVYLHNVVLLLLRLRVTCSLCQP